MDGRRPRPQPPRGVVLDTDGVLLDSARLHAAAWKSAFDACLDELVPGSGTHPRGETQPPFDADAEYRRLVDGRTRYDGARAFLSARGLRLPPGRPDDPPGCGTVWAVAARKEQAFQAVLRAEGVEAFADTAPALTALNAKHVPCGAVSASRHARALLTAAGLDRFLTVVVDGEDSARLGLAGKPDPALFLHAAGLLGTRPEDTVLVEDAVAGVAAARRGHFGLVVGLDRTPDRRTTRRLREEGAETVVPDLVALVWRVWGARG
ncbi:HAD family hydrolase [Streptomyces sp. NPDC056463]|uniref:HAD family hydrolase n=1 Tax=Streptomyces sp. NPDC056463 TaxID=3345827 RepID=UPI0036A6A32F